MSHPADPDQSLLRAVSLDRAGQYAPAAETYEELVDGGTTEADVYANLACIYFSGRFGFGYPDVVVESHNCHRWADVLEVGYVRCNDNANLACWASFFGWFGWGVRPVWVLRGGITPFTGDAACLLWILEQPDEVPPDLVWHYLQAPLVKGTCRSRALGVYAPKVLRGVRF